MPSLFPCPTCQRHVRESERCPFCSASLPAAPTTKVEAPRGVRRVVLFAATAAIAAAGSTDCGSVETASTGASTGSNTGGSSETSSTSSTTASSTTATSNTGGFGGGITFSSSSSSSVASSSGDAGVKPPYGAPPV
ncbi:MAG: hypothetical protein QM820_38150 [Minicystis sp.]